MHKKIGICGCGWLGLPLAMQLKASGYTVLGTSRNKDKLKFMAEQGIQAFEYSLGAPLPWSAAPPDVLVINIPPGRREFDEVRFVAAMTALINQALVQKSHILFISSTSVYGEVSGEIFETTQTQPVTASAKAHAIIEQQVLQGSGTILRLAGLTGPARHPVRHLSGRVLDKGQQPINLVHQQDVITAIKAIIAKQLWRQTFHLSATEHPSRAEFYTWAATAAGLAVPQFSQGNNAEAGRWINASATLDKLGFTLQYPSPYDMPIEIG